MYANTITEKFRRRYLLHRGTLNIDVYRIKVETDHTTASRPIVRLSDHTILIIVRCTQVFPVLIRNFTSVIIFILFIIVIVVIIFIHIIIIIIIIIITDVIPRKLFFPTVFRLHFFLSKISIHAYYRLHFVSSHAFSACSLLSISRCFLLSSPLLSSSLIYFPLLLSSLFFFPLVFSSLLFSPLIISHHHFILFSLFFTDFLFIRIFLDFATIEYFHSIFRRFFFYLNRNRIIISVTIVTVISLKFRSFKS